MGSRQAQPTPQLTPPSPNTPNYQPATNKNPKTSSQLQPTHPFFFLRINVVRCIPQRALAILAVGHGKAYSKAVGLSFSSKVASPKVQSL